MTQKAKKIDNFNDALGQINKQFSSFSLSLDFFFLYRQDNIEHVLTSFQEIPYFSLLSDPFGGCDTKLHSSWEDINKNEIRKREEPNVDIFGTIIDAVYDWQKIYDNKLSPYKATDMLYVPELKERRTIITSDLRDCNLIEIYRWGFYIRTDNIFSLIAAIHNIEEENGGDFHKYDYLSNKLAVSMHEKIGFEWPKLTRDISLLEGFWQKENDNTEIMDDLLYDEEIDDIDVKDYTHLDI